MPKAIEYLGLVGKYVKATRNSTDEELRMGAPRRTTGGSGIIYSVWDDSVEEKVHFMFDDGYGFTVDTDSDWRFCVALREEFYGEPVEKTWS